MGTEAPKDMALGRKGRPREDGVGGRQEGRMTLQGSQGSVVAGERAGWQFLTRLTYKHVTAPLGI